MTTGRNKKNRITKHGRIKRSGSVKPKISQLRWQWDVLDAATRGERLRELIELGCTRAGLAQDLDVSATNVRFHLDLAEINPVQKQAVKEGASAKVAFAAVHKQREVQARNGE